MPMLEHVFTLLDPWLIAPYRWVTPPEAGFFLGTALLALQCVLLGDAAMLGVMTLNRKRLNELQHEMDHHHHLSEKALQMGDKESYKAVNKQGLDAFGHSFSLGAAIFCVSIWPLPFALGWMQGRFSEASPRLPFHIPFVGDEPTYLFYFLLLYIIARVTYKRLLGKTSFYSRLRAWVAQG